MSGEYYSTCSACGGTGKRTIGSTSIGSGTQPKTESCSTCSGTGQILGVPATVQDLQAYASEPCEVEDQIFALAKQIQQPRQGRVAHQVVDRKMRQVTVRKQRKVGGFLGIGARTEYYDEVETKPYDEAHTEYVDQLVQPHDIALGEWQNRQWASDPPGQVFRLYEYRAMLLSTGELALQEKHTETFENLTCRPPIVNQINEKTEWRPLPVTGLAGITVHFDFSVSCGDGNRMTAQFIPENDYYWARDWSSFSSRLYQKGYGLLTKLQSILDNGVS